MKNESNKKSKKWIIPVAIIGALFVIMIVALCLTGEGGGSTTTTAGNPFYTLPTDGVELPPDWFDN